MDEMLEILKKSGLEPTLYLNQDRNRGYDFFFFPWNLCGT